MDVVIDITYTRVILLKWSEAPRSAQDFRSIVYHMVDSFCFGSSFFNIKDVREPTQTCLQQPLGLVTD